MRRACAKDANQDAIAEALARLGWDVIDSHEFAQYEPGFADLICERCADVFFVEVKMPGEDLTETEKAFWARHPYLPLRVLRTVEDCIRMTGVYVT